MTCDALLQSYTVLRNSMQYSTNICYIFLHTADWHFLVAPCTSGIRFTLQTTPKEKFWGCQVRWIWYKMIYLLTAIGLSPGGSTHLHTNNTKNNTNNNRTTQIQTNAGRSPSLQVLSWHLPYTWGKSTEKISVRVRKTSVRLTHCGRVTKICVFNTVKLGTSASSP